VQIETLLIEATPNCALVNPKVIIQEKAEYPNAKEIKVSRTEDT